MTNTVRTLGSMAQGQGSGTQSREIDSPQQWRNDFLTLLGINLAINFPIDSIDSSVVDNLDVSRIEAGCRLYTFVSRYAAENFQRYSTEVDTRSRSQQRSA